MHAAIDANLFPNTPFENDWPSYLFWTSSPVVGGSGDARLVYFGYGSVSYCRRDGYSHVRLVRVTAGS